METFRSGRWTVCNGPAVPAETELEALRAVAQAAIEHVKECWEVNFPFEGFPRPWGLQKALENAGLLTISCE